GCDRTGGGAGVDRRLPAARPAGRLRGGRALLERDPLRARSGGSAATRPGAVRAAAVAAAGDRGDHRSARARPGARRGRAGRDRAGGIGGCAGQGTSARPARRARVGRLKPARAWYTWTSTAWEATCPTPN